MNLHLELCWQFDAAGLRLEPRLFELLRGIEKLGSLHAAAQQTKISYRQAWALVRRWSTVFGRPLVKMERGRGTSLLPLGHKLMWIEQRLTARLAPELETAAAQANHDLANVIYGSAPKRLHMIASHDLALVTLRQWLPASRSLYLDLEFRGSVESLKLLRANKCDLAGFHVPEGMLGARLVGRYRPWLTNKSHRLIEVAR